MNLRAALDVSRFWKERIHITKDPIDFSIFSATPEITMPP
jgi:hypothetical protein